MPSVEEANKIIMARIQRRHDPLGKKFPTSVSEQPELPHRPRKEDLPPGYGKSEEVKIETLPNYDIDKKAPVQEETPVTEKAPLAEKVSVQEEAPVTTQAPATEEAPVQEEVSVTGKVPFLKGPSNGDAFTQNKINQMIARTPARKPGPTAVCIQLWVAAEQ